MTEPATSEPTTASSFTATKSGIHHFGCTPGSGIHHQDDCPHGVVMGSPKAVPITFDTVPESGLSVCGMDVKTIDGDPPTQIATVFWTEGL